MVYGCLEGELLICIVRSKKTIKDMYGISRSFTNVQGWNMMLIKLSNFFYSFTPWHNEPATTCVGYQAHRSRPS